MKSFALAAAVLLLAAAEVVRGSEARPTLEIVTFRLAPGTDAATLLNAARGTEAFLRSRGAVSGRWLAVDDDGLWTDVVLWSSRSAALSASEAAMKEPSFEAFLATIDPGSIGLRHTDVILQME